MPISFDAPCRQDWSTFTPVGERSRHCQSCDTTVVDMSQLTRRAAEKLVIASGGKMCGRLRVDARGAPIFRRETERAPGLLSLAAASLLAACGSTTDDGNSPVAMTEAPSTGGDHLLGDGTASAGSLASPMMPLSDDRDLAREAAVSEPGTSIAAVVTDEDDLEVVPTADQLLLTEAKDGEEAPVRPAHGTARRRRDPAATDVTTPARGRRNNGSAHVTAPSTTSLPAVNTPPEMMMMGGISYTP